MITLGAMIFASFIVVIGLVVNGVRMDNEYLKRKEETKNRPWNWD